MKRVIQLILLILVSLLGLASFADAIVIENPLTSEDIGAILTNIADKLANIIGGVTAIMFIASGILYLTSAGNPEKINSAKKCLTYAIIGLVVVLLAKGIIKYVQGWFPG